MEICLTARVVNLNLLFIQSFCEFSFESIISFSKQTNICIFVVFSVLFIEIILGEISTEDVKLSVKL